jgi:hypothetical protein
MLALLRAPAAAAGAAAPSVLAGCLRLSAAIAAPLDRSWLRGRAGASSRLLAVLRTANSGFRAMSETRGGAVQLLVDELDDDLANELGDGTAQLVSDERLERLGRRSHAWSLRRGIARFRGIGRGWRVSLRMRSESGIADDSPSVVTVTTLFDGFEQAFLRWQSVEQAPQDPVRTFIPLFEVLEWAACVHERLEFIDWSPDLRGLRWARNRCRHDWAMVLEVRTRDDLRLHPNVDRESVPEQEWAWRAPLPEAKKVSESRRGDEVFYYSHLAGKPARVTLNLIHAFFAELRPHYR